MTAAAPDLAAAVTAKSAAAGFTMTPVGPNGSPPDPAGSFTMSGAEADGAPPPSYEEEVLLSRLTTTTGPAAKAIPHESSRSGSIVRAEVVELSATRLVSA